MMAADPDIFGGVDEWRSAMVALNDQTFFKLINAALGGVKSPYNKQKLIEELQSFLSRGDIQQAIDSLIDVEDMEAIAAAALLNAPSVHELAEFLAIGEGFAEAAGRVAHLEERFILYRRLRGGAPAISLNPVLAGILGKYAADYSYILPSYIKKRGDQSGAGGDVYSYSRDLVTAAVIAFASNNGSLFKADGVPKKSAAKQAAAVFGTLDITPCIHIFCILGLLQKHDGGFTPNSRAIAAFSRLSPYQRQIYYAGAVYISGVLPHWEQDVDVRNQISAIAQLIYNFLNTLTHVKEKNSDAVRMYPEKTVLRLCLLLRRSLSRESQVYFNAKQIKNLINAVTSAGLLAQNGGLYVPVLYGGREEKSAYKKTGQRLIFNGSFSFVMNAGADFAEAEYVLRFSTLIKLDITAGRPFLYAEITRQSAVRAFDGGVSAHTIIGTIKKLSGNRQAEALVWSINEWEARYNEVAVFDGITVTLSPEKRYLADIEPLRDLIGFRPAPGVLILNTHDWTAALDVLKKCGLDAVARPMIYSPAHKDDEEKTRAGYEFELKTAENHTLMFDTAPQEGAGGVPSVQQARLREIHERKNELFERLSRMNMPQTRRDALKNMIEKRIIVLQQQLELSFIAEEKLEAHGLDYTGKNNIAKQALDAEDMLEIQINGSAERLFARPLSIEKHGTGGFLTIKLVNNVKKDAQEIITVDLGKISSLRRIKNSIL
ncbi:MAG: hypothetical protein LBD20_02265 [Spirochaetaceae bacterium]|jgi:hypothetical protein|nr:hypothetical protein [Spirochaetaceae bacterium]